MAGLDPAIQSDKVVGFIPGWPDRASAGTPASLSGHDEVLMYDSNNVFAKILRGEIPCVKVFEDDRTLALMDVMPQAEGHVLVVPKEPAENIFTLSPEGAAAMMATTQRLAKAVQKGLDAPGVMLAQLNGTAAGQSVFHVHFHIIPRRGGVDMHLHARDMVDPKLLEPVAAKIRSAL